MSGSKLSVRAKEPGLECHHFAALLDPEDTVTTATASLGVTQGELQLLSLLLPAGLCELAGAGRPPGSIAPCHCVTICPVLSRGQILMTHPTVQAV